MADNNANPPQRNAPRREAPSRSSAFLTSLSITIALVAIVIFPSLMKQYKESTSSSDSSSVWSLSSLSSLRSDPVAAAQALSEASIINSGYATTYPLTAVFVGGTSGIGRGMVENFAARMSNSSTASQVFVVGRSAQSADEIHKSFQNLGANAPVLNFISIDLTLMRNVRQVSEAIMKTAPKINFLIMSPGIMTMRERTDTDEGIDEKLALHYYSRWAFIHHLLPALHKAKESGEDAKVMSVLAAGQGKEVDVTDLGLERDYRPSRAGFQMPTYNDLMMEEYATRNPEISFIHSNPGFVRTPLIDRSDYWLLRLTSPVIKLFVWTLAVSPEECAQYLWAGINRSDKGVHRIGSKGEDLGLTDYRGNDEHRKLVWDHTTTKVLGIRTDTSHSVPLIKRYPGPS